jgi:hypothetical protein
MNPPFARELLFCTTVKKNTPSGLRPATPLEKGNFGVFSFGFETLIIKIKTNLDA